MPILRPGTELCLKKTKETCQSTITQCFRNVSTRPKPNLRDIGSKNLTKPVSPVKQYNQKQKEATLTSFLKSKKKTLYLQKREIGPQ